MLMLKKQRLFILDQVARDSDLGNCQKLIISRSLGFGQGFEIAFDDDSQLALLESFELAN